MTSQFTRNGGLREQTLDAYNRSCMCPRGVDERLNFYLTYLEDVVPSGVTVDHVPVELDNGGRVSVRNPPREEILLTMSGKIFMFGLVSMEYNPRTLEKTTGDEAFTQWLNGDYIPDGENWRFFTCQSMILFFNSHHDDDWECVSDFDPIDHVDQVAAFLQREADSVMSNKN